MPGSPLLTYGRPAARADSAGSSGSIIPRRPLCGGSRSQRAGGCSCHRGSCRARSQSACQRYHLVELRPLAAKLQQLVDRIDPHAGRYRMLFESSPLPMWVADDQTLRFLAVNEAALKVYGYTRAEFLRMNASDLRRADERRDFLRNEPGGTVYRGIYRHRRKNGEPLDIEGVGHLVRWRGQQARLVVISDITE